MGKILEDLRETCRNTTEMIKSIDWDKVIYDYLELQGYIKEFKFKVLKNLSDPTYIVDVNLGSKTSLCESLSEFIFGNYELTVSDDELITILKRVADKNIMRVVINETGDVGLLVQICDVKK